MPIVGEVEYYLVENDYFANFIGTDYTYSQQASLRNIFNDNLLRPEDNAFEEYINHLDSFGRLLELDNRNLELLGRAVQSEINNPSPGIRVPFKKGVMFGAVFLAYIMITCLAINIAGDKVS